MTPAQISPESTRPRPWFAVNGHHESFTIPADETLDLNGKTFNGERLMDVVWNGKVVMMFTADLKLATVVI